MRDMPLIWAIQQWLEPQRRRWHTPGHKGRMPPFGEFLQWSWDVTEVGPIRPPGADVGPVAASERLAAQEFGVERTRYSVQGATLPVMAGILAAFPPGSRVAVERHCHRSVLAAAIVGDLEPVWIAPRLGPGGALVPPPVADWLAAVEGVAGAVVTRPTYDGLAEDLSPVVQAFHRLGKPVVVDEAHGAHWANRPDFPASAIALGADIVVHGTHKTESALTQTGLLHRQGNRVADGAIDWWWKLLSTSSPSYLLLASLDRYRATRAGEDAFWAQLAVAAAGLRARLSDGGLTVLQSWAQTRGLAADPAKLTLVGPAPDWARSLKSRHAWEKVEPNLLSFILTPDSDVAELADDLLRLKPADLPDARFPDWPRSEMVERPSRLIAAPLESVPLAKSAGRVAARPITPYPPGISLLVPGERIEPEHLQWIDRWREKGDAVGAWTLDGLLGDGQIEVMRA